jgi:hypothetical protein
MTKGVAQQKSILVSMVRDAIAKRPLNSGTGNYRSPFV